jgi:hypothetical protein
MGNHTDLEPLQMWEPLLELLKSTNPLIRSNTARVCATSLQNNPAAQNSVWLLACDSPACVPTIWAVLR